MLTLLYDCTIFEPGTGYLRKVVAYEVNPQQVSSEKSSRDIFFLNENSLYTISGYGMCTSILSIRALLMLSLPRYKTVNPIDLRHGRDQWLCKFRGTKETLCMRKSFKPHKIFLGSPAWLPFHCLAHQYGRREVMRKRCYKAVAVAYERWLSMCGSSYLVLTAKI